MKKSATQRLKERLVEEGFHHKLDWRNQPVTNGFHLEKDGHEVSYVFHFMGDSYGGGWVDKKICGFEKGWYITRQKTIRCSKLLLEIDLGY